MSQKKVVLIGGMGEGLGSALAHWFTTKNYQVIGINRSTNCQIGKDIVQLKVDLSEPSQVSMRRSTRGAFWTRSFGHRGELSERLGTGQVVATDQDIKESPKHAEFDTIKHQEELESLRLHLAASEFAQLEAGYLEGALLAADAAVHSIKSYSQKDSSYIL